MDWAAGTPQYAEYAAPAIAVREALRYAGYPPGADVPEEAFALMQKAVSLSRGQLAYRVGHVCVPVSWDGDGFALLPFAQRSANLARALAGCSQAVVFAATVGAGMDRLIRRYERADAALAVMLQGLGAERAEALCDEFCNDLAQAAAEQGFRTHPRYSPGYGDLPLDVQADVLALLDAPRRLGITLSASSLMSPTKTVTAIVGLKRV